MLNMLRGEEIFLKFQPNLHTPQHELYDIHFPNVQ